MSAMEGAQAQVDDAHRELAGVGDGAPLLGDTTKVGKAKSQRVYRSLMGVANGGPADGRRHYPYVGNTGAAGRPALVH